MRQNQIFRIAAAYPDPAVQISLHTCGGCVSLRRLLLNSFKHILHNSVTPNRMEIERLFPFHSRTSVETLAQQCPRSMEANLDVFLSDVKDVRGIGRAHLLYV